MTKTESTDRAKVIFFGNGPLAEYALAVIERECQVIFHARTKDDLERIREAKIREPEAHGILASFGILIPESILKIFEPEGILNIHPSLLPLYRGASPIESAILAGDNSFSVSVMKLVKTMDAGPIYWQETLDNLPLRKDEIYKLLAKTGAEWIVKNLNNLPEPISQDDTKATFCGKLDKKMSFLTPGTDTADATFRKIVAYQGYPKPKHEFYGVRCIVIDAHVLRQGETADLVIPCSDGRVIAVDRLQPEGRKIMDAQSFMNGYKK